MNKITRAVALCALLASCGEAPQSSAGKQTADAEPAKEEAGTFTSEKLTERMIHRRAVEAVIWATPVVNYELMVQAMLHSTSAKQNEIVYWSKPVTWKNQTLTPNPDAIYFMTFLNTKDAGPMVIEVPPADSGSFAANIDDIWQMPLEDAGPFGADEGKGGKYLILPPGFEGKTPKGYFVLPCNTYGAYALLRANLPSHSAEDIAKAAAYGRRLKVYPLTSASNPPETKFTDAAEILFNSTLPFDLRFFQSLDRVVQSEPWLTRDKAMIDVLKTIGIEKGRPFAPDEKMTGILNAAAKEAHAYLVLLLEKGFPPYYDNAHWALPAYPEMIQAAAKGYEQTDIYPVDVRALTYSIGYIGIKRFGTAQFYLFANKDKDGAPLDGSVNYRLHVPPNVPTKQYWSATVYDGATHALIKDLDGASRASNDAAVQKNADGSVDVYLSPKAPEGKEANWVPTRTGAPFEVLFRLYGPEKALFEKTWKLPDIEKIN